MKKHIIPTMALGLIGATSAHAATVLGELQSTAGAATLPSPIAAVSDDLLQTAFGSVTGGMTSDAILRDGVTGGARDTGTTMSGLWVDEGGTTQTTYTLDISTNFNGYDIEDIRVFTGWDSNRAQAGYDISYSTVGSAGFTPLGTVDSPADQGANNSSADWSFLTRTYNDAGGAIAGLTGVDAIRFDWDFTDNANGGTRGPVIREIDIIGTAVAIPEPSSTALLGLGALALVMRRRK